MKKYYIIFRDSRRLQRTMLSDSEQEVKDYISNKYKLEAEKDFKVSEDINKRW
jgi:hypothetical protein